MARLAPINIISEASRPRAALAVAIPLAFPLILSLALSRSGHSIFDYFHLIGTGQLSWFRQLIMWTSLVVFAIWYVPAAVVALKSKIYIAVGGDLLFLPGQEKIEVRNIRSLAVKKKFVHRVLIVNVSGDINEVVITFSKEGLENIRGRIRRDPSLCLVLSD